MSQVSSVDSFLRCLGLIFLKARKEMSSQMQERGSLCALAFQAKKSTLDNGMRVLNCVGWYLPKKTPFKVLINFGSLLQCEYVSVKRLLPATPLSGRSLHAILNLSVLDWMWLVAFLQNDLRWGAAMRDSGSWRAAGVTVRDWGKRSNSWGVGVLCPIVGVEEDRRQRQTEEKESTMLSAAVKLMWDCTECLHTDLCFPVKRESLRDV